MALVALGGALRFFSGPRVLVQHPVKGPAVQAIYATGTVESEIMLPITTRAAARLVELNVDEGAQVKKGQILARLESEELQRALSALRAKEVFAKEELDRNAALVKKKVVAPQAFDLARSDWLAAKAQADRAEAEANYMTLTAPADGQIIRRDGEIGQLITANQAVFWISAVSPLRITAQVDEEDISQVKVGQQVLIRADAFPGKTFRGKVKSLTPKGDPVARSYRVRVEFSEPTELQIGMTAETNIIVSEKSESLLVPTPAIKNERLWVVRDSTLVEQPVTLGVRGLTETEVLSGVTAEDLVVTQPEESFKDGRKVRAVLSE